MKKKTTNLMDYMNKEFYIIDCKDFIYFARKVHIIGFEISSDDLAFITDIKDELFDKHRKMYKEELEQFKSFDEASKRAKELNEIPENKRRVGQLYKNKQRILEMQYYNI